MKKFFNKDVFKTTALLVIGFLIGDYSTEAENFVKGTKEFVVLENGKSISSAFQQLDLKIKSRLKHQDGYVVEMSESAADDLELRGHRVFENRIYNISFSSKPDFGDPGCPDAERRPWPPRKPQPCKQRPCKPVPCEACPECPTDPTTPTDPIDPVVITDEAPWGVVRTSSLEAMEKSKTQGSDITVCVIDTGADSDHIDLKDAIDGGESTIPGVLTFEDDQGHGTHVASTVAAVGNNGPETITGVSQARLYIVKALDSFGSGRSSWIADAIDSCRENKTEIISMSLGSPAEFGPDPLIAEAIDRALDADIYVVAAAGNDGKATGFPAGLDFVWAVSASTQDDKIAGFSSRGPKIDFIAPGDKIKGARMGGGYSFLSGTSMATPHVSGILALALSAGKKTLVTEDLGLDATEQGQGLPNAEKSIE